MILWYILSRIFFEYLLLWKQENENQIIVILENYF